VSTDIELSVQFPITQDFNAIARAVSEAGFAQSSLVHSSIVFKIVESAQIDRQKARAVAGVVEAALGNATDERHLTAFETNSNRTARARGLAFAAASAGFSMAGGFALAQAFATVFGAGTRFKIV
jgi:hypothetical protein